MNSKLQGIINGVSTALQTGVQLAQNKDTSDIELQIQDIQESPTTFNDYDSLMASYNAYSPFKTNYSKEDIASVSDTNKVWGTALSGITGAINGSSMGLLGVIGGAATDLLGSSIGAGIGSLRAKEKAEQLNTLASEANNMYLRQFNNNAGNIKNKTFRNATLNLSALGGPLDSFTKSRLLTKSFKMKPRKMKYGGFGNYFAYGGDLSGDWTNGVTIIDEGGTHEQNPYEGVLVGVDAQGTPNLVEEGEVIFNDYVYSNRLKPTAKQLEDVKLDPKFEGMTFADIAKEVQKESSIRPLDPISKNTLVDSMSKLTAIQEETRANKAQRQFMKEFRAMTPEEQQDALIQMMPQEEPQPSEIMSEQDAMNMLNGRTPRAYQGIRKEMPQMEDEEFAFGGNLFKTGGLPYNNSNGFKYFNNGAYDKDYLEWLNNLKFEGEQGQALFNQLSEHYKKYYPNDILTKEKAIQLGQDNKFGDFHSIFGLAYDKSKFKTIPSITPNPILTPNKVDYSYKNKLAKKEDTKHKDNSLEYPNSNFLQFAPVLGSLIGLFGNEPNYSNADLIAKGRRGIRDIRARAIGNYLQYNPFDTNFEQNKLAGITAGTQRAVINNSANRGQAIASLLPLYGQELTQLGQLYRSAREYNDTQRKAAADFNRGTDLYNAQFGMQTDQTNSSLDAQRANLYTQEANMRDAIETAASQAKSQNITNLFDNLGNLGRSMYTDQQMKWLYENGYIPTMNAKNGGKVKRKKKGLLR